uniref:Uncharacterized protein n=1 Tax=Arundo donax TaxID=35708 RepID=A0A0A9DR03_ARUDO
MSSLQARAFPSFMNNETGLSTPQLSGQSFHHDPQIQQLQWCRCPMIVRQRTYQHSFSSNLRMEVSIAQSACDNSRFS